MSKEQIEEMARDICHLTVSCEECTMLASKTHQTKEQYCKAMTYANRAYAKDYRKQIVGEWVDKTNPCIANCYACSVCDEQVSILGSKPKYCPNCGARMGGGAE